MSAYRYISECFSNTTFPTVRENQYFRLCRYYSYYC